MFSPWLHCRKENIGAFMTFTSLYNGQEYALFIPSKREMDNLVTFYYVSYDTLSADLKGQCNFLLVCFHFINLDDVVMREGKQISWSVITLKRVNEKGKLNHGGIIIYYLEIIILLLWLFSSHGYSFKYKYSGIKNT